MSNSVPAVVWLLIASSLVGCTSATQEATLPTSSEGLLWSGLYPDVTLQIDFVTGAAPGEFALDALERAVRELTGRQRVEIVGPRAIEGARGDPDRNWTPEGMDSFVERHFPAQPRWRGEGPLLHILYLDGTMDTGDRRLFGFSSGYEIFVLPHAFRADVEFPGQDRIERAVILHEFGHSLGLVGCGIPAVTDHGDGDCHSANERSVMYPDIDSDLSSMLLDRVQEGEWIRHEFDEADLEDIAAFRRAQPRP